jgi:hypothetical protein
MVSPFGTIGMMIGKKVEIGFDSSKLKITETKAGQWVYNVK